jgi:uncharacterized protein YjiS (DUF1127 family)
VKLLTENIFVRYWRYMLTWRKHREAIKQLNALSDATLIDIGINRCQIDELIFKKEDRMKRGTKQ